MTICNVFLTSIGIPIVRSVENQWINVGIGGVDFTKVVDVEGGVVDSCEFGIVEVWGVQEVGAGVVQVGAVGGDYGGRFLFCCGGGGGFGESRRSDSGGDEGVCE